MSPKLLNAILILLLISCIGSVGYYLLLPGIDFADALYMTVITLSTVGYGEITPMTPEAKVFTIFFIMTSLIAFGYGIKELPSLLFLKIFLKKSNKKK
jgi:voltage-gated potassium channel